MSIRQTKFKMRKKRILFHSDFTLSKTGFGRNAKAVLEFLYKTGKYEIINLATQFPRSHPELSRTPWKSIGTLPDDPQQAQSLQQGDGSMLRAASYGVMCIDDIIKEIKPDVYLGVEDIWGVCYSVEKPWFDKINSIIWTTLDSLPLHDEAIRLAPKIKNYWMWSDFATQEFHKLSQKHVKTMHGAIDASPFKKLLNTEKKALRAKYKIPEDAFIAGFVFRNQLRKSVPNLLEGFSLFQRDNRQINAKLLLHTSWKEGWEIPKLAKEYGVSLKDIYTTYICEKCLEYEVKNFDGIKSNCPFCKSKLSQHTAHPRIGVTEEQLNEIYNLMDCYVHPFTSGGLEIPIVEAKLAELITLVTNYSCGEEHCYEEANSLPLEWAEYREFESHFKKASTYPSSIARQLAKVSSMKPEKRIDMGKAARNWALKNFDIKNVGQLIEAELDAMHFIEYDFKFESQKRNPDYIMPQIEDDAEWLVEMYHNILKMSHINKKHEDVHGWLLRMKDGFPRDEVEKCFRNIAAKENNQIARSQTEFSELLDKDDAGKRLLMVIPEAIGDVFCSTALFRSIKETYPQYNLYVATKPENFDVLDGNEYVHKIIPYIPNMDNLLWSEGFGPHKGWFEVTFLPYIGTQKMFMSHHNGQDKLALNNKYEN